ncbi:MAG TPA: MarR family transcriptional regulator [Thermoanaerobaculia bacterium]|nr:MarR family transcriptional regulator [Thermoanaerobaculia bacterium]
MAPIQEELKQNRPFRTRSEEAAVALMRTADLVRRTVGAVVEPVGITPQQYNVLRILRGAGEAGLPTLEIAERMIEQTPGITRLIDRLEAKGLVRRERCLTDRRQVFCRISGEGLSLLERLDEPIREADAAALRSLGDHDLERLIELLDKTRRAYRRIQ